LQHFFKINLKEIRLDKLFDEIIGYEDIKKLFTMTLCFKYEIHILLSGSPACANTMFLQSLVKSQNSYFVDGRSTTKSGLIDYVFDNRPDYLLIDEIDKMSAKDEGFLLNLMETGTVCETKHRKTRTAKVKTFVYPTSNTIHNVMTPLQSQFFIVKLEPYTCEQFYEVTTRLFTGQKYNVNEE
jgi:DNA replicative helicase MCM subunit Mcm2 (Cdc46/Mcm family)